MAILRKSGSVHSMCSKGVEEDKTAPLTEPQREAVLAVRVEEVGEDSSEL